MPLKLPDLHRLLHTHPFPLENRQENTHSYMHKHTMPCIHYKNLPEHGSKNIGESTFCGRKMRIMPVHLKQSYCYLWEQTLVALLIRHIFVVLIPYQCSIATGFTLKIQMSSPLPLICTFTGRVALVSHVHITCWWHDKGKMGSAPKSMLTYAVSRAILAVMWQRVSETPHLGYSVDNYVPSKGPEAVTKKFECDFSSQEATSAVTLATGPH